MIIDLLELLQNILIVSKEEFLNVAPATLEHEIWGTVYLKIIIDEPQYKGCSYHNRGGSTTHSTYGEDWDKVFDLLMSRLRKHGF